MKIRILPEAENDLKLVADFYESQRQGLGTYFNDCLRTERKLSIHAVSVNSGGKNPEPR
jgi:hypothetical protein